MKKYLTRLIEKKIERKLKTSGAVFVTGPKFSGKTTTCMLFQKSNISLFDDRLIKTITADPSIALKGEFPRLIDEWQNIPNLWNLIRQKVDRNGEFGEYILTGSATPIDSKEIHHSGTGRITTVKMRPMSDQSIAKLIFGISKEKKANRHHSRWKNRIEKEVVISLFPIIIEKKE